MTDPVTIPGLVEFIQDRFQTKPTRTSEDEGAGKRDATTKPWLNDSTLSTDPFSVLPVELLHEILSYLPAKDILALSSASMAFLGASRRNRVWKNLIVHDFPWFWELEELLAGCRSSGRGLDLNLDLDCKRLYLWLGERTELLRYNEGPFLGLVNRRRIWGACAEVKGLYLRKLEVKASA